MHFFEHVYCMRVSFQIWLYYVFQRLLYFKNGDSEGICPRADMIVRAYTHILHFSNQYDDTMLHLLVSISTFYFEESPGKSWGTPGTEPSQSHYPDTNWQVIMLIF